MTDKLLRDFPNATQGEPLSRHTSFRIGGPADMFFLPACADELVDIYKKCQKLGCPFTLIGDGTNVLVVDKGIRGAVVSTKHMNGYKLTEDGQLRAFAGARLSELSWEAYNMSFDGLEFASGIPGTIGGAVYMNAGAFGSEICDFVESVVAFGEEKHVFSKEEMEFGYRKSILQDGSLIVLEVNLNLQIGVKSEIKKKMAELNSRRKESQPLDSLSAGSTFKRPPGGFAAELIDKAGLKGMQIGGARVSDKHAGFIVNTGNASAKDVLDLMEAVQQKVYESSGVFLEPEVRVLGA